MFRKRRYWLIVTILILILGGSYFYYTTTVVATDSVDSEPAIQTTVVRQGDLTISATGAGTVIPAMDIALNFSSSGILSELLVQVGDKVQAGEVLARLSDYSAQQAVATAELQLAQSKMQANPESTELGLSFNDISIEQARINLDLAKSDLENLQNWEADAAEIAQAEANLAAAQASLTAAQGQEAASNSNITVNNINLEQAQRALADAQVAYVTAFDPGREWELYMTDATCQPGQGGNQPCSGPSLRTQMENERASAESAVIRAEDNLAIAQANYNSAVASTNHSSSTNAQSSVLSSEQALVEVQMGPTDDEIEIAQMAVRQAELTLQQALLNQEASALSLAQSQLNLEVAQQTLADTVLIAPVSGTIISIAADVGESVGAEFITLADLEQPMIELFMDETDFNTVSLDYEVDVVFDALPDDTFSGHVVQIDPLLSNVNGVTAVRALVQLDTNSFAKPQTLPVGLNATVEVIGGQAQDALLVPVEAIRELSPGEFAVFVMENEEPKLRFVEVGLMDFTFAEILSGLEAGEVVTTGIVETQ